jgi:pimeloyl-ACP methyl ester carboxylesterase
MLAILMIGLAENGEAQNLDLEFESVTGGGGVTLSVGHGGNPAGPDILFIHGFSQSYLSWEEQIDSDLGKAFSITVFDLRGHGASAKPVEPESYQSTRMWGDDIAAIIRKQALDRPVLVGWSWAGFVIMNYIRHHGVGDIAGINLVGANTSLKGPVSPPPPGPGQDMQWLGQMLSPDIALNLAGVTTFIDLMTAQPMAADVREANIAFNMMTPHYVRRAMMGYPSDNSDLAEAITVPVLISHGTDDPIVAYEGAAATANVLSDASVSTYENTGHAPFMEKPERFNDELAAFVRRVQ